MRAQLRYTPASPMNAGASASPADKAVNKKVKSNRPRSESKVDNKPAVGQTASGVALAMPAATAGDIARQAALTFPAATAVADTNQAALATPATAVADAASGKAYAHLLFCSWAKLSCSS